MSGLLEAARGQPVAKEHRACYAEGKNQKGVRQQANRVLEQARSQAHVVEHGRYRE